jgi:hypothetical protein
VQCHLFGGIIQVSIWGLVQKSGEIFSFLGTTSLFFYPMNGLVQKQAKRLAHSIHWFIITIPIKIAISKLENSHSFICCPTPALENWPHLERDLG